MFIGGNNSHILDFKYASDASTMNAQAHILLHYSINYIGIGILSLICARMILALNSWHGYFIGLIVIGIFEFSFLINLLINGIININMFTIIGPVIFILAIIITPLGLVKIIK